MSEKKKVTTIEEENEQLKAKYQVEDNDINHIRKMYHLTKTVGELKPSFMDTLVKAVVVPARPDQNVSKHAYGYYDFNNKLITIPFQMQCWITKSALKTISRHATFVDAFEMENKNKQFRVQDPNANVIASDQMVRAYIISTIVPMESLKKK